VSASLPGSSAPLPTQGLWPFRALLLASILGPLLLWALASWQDYRQLNREADEDVHKTVDILYEHTGKVLESLELVLRRVDEHIAGMSWDEIAASDTLHRYLERIDEESPQIAAIWLIDETGHGRNSSVVFLAAAGVDVHDQDYFVALRDADEGTFLGGSALGLAPTDQVSFNVARRRGGRDEGFDGVIDLVISPEYFANFYASVTARSRNVVTLVRSDGAVLARGPVRLFQPFTFSPHSGIMDAIARRPEGGIYESTSEIDGTDRIYGYRKLHGYPIYVSFGLARDDVTMQWYHDVLVGGVLAAVAAMALALLSFLALHQARQEHRALQRWQETATSLREEIARREAAEASLRQAQKMEAVGQLTGGIAHDFNNLLTVIIGNVESLTRQLPHESTVLQRFAAAALSGAMRAANLTQRLLAFSRQQPLAPTALDLNKLISELSELLRRSLGETITVETVMAGGLWRSFADRNQLENALLNLAINARDAMPEGGKLTIETANIYLDETYAAQHDELKPGQYVMLAVTDTGTGMPQEIAARAFEPFFTTKGVGKGSGLGLSMVYGFIKQSQGHIKIYSELGHGTSIKLYLPRAAEPEGAMPTSSPEGPPRLSHRGRRILVVEDDEAVRRYAVEMLGELGYTVRSASDSEAARRIIAEEPSFDLLFTDVGLPGPCNGRQLAAEARHRHPGLKVLFTTGYTRNAIVHNGILDRDVDLIGKPFTYEALAATVARVLDAA